MLRRKISVIIGEGRRPSRRGAHLHGLLVPEHGLGAGVLLERVLARHAAGVEDAAREVPEVAEAGALLHDADAVAALLVADCPGAVGEALLGPAGEVGLQHRLHAVFHGVGGDEEHDGPGQVLLHRGDADGGEHREHHRDGGRERVEGVQDPGRGVPHLVPEPEDAGGESLEDVAAELDVLDVAGGGVVVAHGGVSALLAIAGLRHGLRREEAGHVEPGAVGGGGGGLGLGLRLRCFPPEAGVGIHGGDRVRLQGRGLCLAGVCAAGSVFFVAGVGGLLRGGERRDDGRGVVVGGAGRGGGAGALVDLDAGGGGESLDEEGDVLVHPAEGDAHLARDLPALHLVDELAEAAGGARGEGHEGAGGAGGLIGGRRVLDLAEHVALGLEAGGAHHAREDAEAAHGVLGGDGAVLLAARVEQGVAQVRGEAADLVGITRLCELCEGQLRHREAHVAEQIVVDLLLVVGGLDEAEAVGDEEVGFPRVGRGFALEGVVDRELQVGLVVDAPRDVELRGGPGAAREVAEERSPFAGRRLVRARVHPDGRPLPATFLAQLQARTG
jgi:hypothetical protein